MATVESYMAEGWLKYGALHKRRMRLARASSERAAVGKHRTSVHRGVAGGAYNAVAAGGTFTFCTLIVVGVPRLQQTSRTPSWVGTADSRGSPVFRCFTRLPPKAKVRRSSLGRLDYPKRVLSRHWTGSHAGKKRGPAETAALGRVKVNNLQRETADAAVLGGVDRHVLQLRAV